jgi:hypothetical protein
MRRVLLLFLLTLAASAAGARTEPAAGEVGVSGVQFKLVRPGSGAAGDWLQIDVTLDARPAPDSPGRRLSRVRVTLMIGCDVFAGGAPKRSEYHRAEAEAVALGAGTDHVRFYLPPEIVQRDGVRGAPSCWRVDVTVGGHPQRPVLTRFSASLATVEARRRFLQQSAAGAEANAGMLLPQYLTPFALDYPTTTPSFIRRDPTN